MSPPRAKARDVRSVFFDFDYTLVDSSVGVIECVNYALKQMGLPLAEPDRIRSLIGVSLDKTFVELSAGRAAGRFEEFKRLFTQRGDEVMLDGVRLFEPVKSAVARLLSGGLTLGIVSTKFRYRVEAVLRREGLADAFAVVVGGEDVAAHKPDPQGLFLAMERLSVDAGSALFVGDSVIDAETAIGAGVGFVAVLSGVTRTEALAAYRPLAIVADVGEVPAFVLALRESEGVRV